jgi:hypothetical protein
MGNKMRLTVEAVSATKKGFKSGGAWYNRAKGATFPDFGGISKGDEVEVQADGQWVKDLVVMSGGTPATSSAAASVSVGVKGSSRDEAIIRQSSVKAVLESPVIAAMLKDLDRSEAITEAKKLIVLMTNYSTTGKFDETNA